MCNITNHSYFNLNGSGSAMGHRLWVDADAFTPINADSLPTALSAPVEGTPFDFRAEKPLGRDIGADHEQLRLAGGTTTTLCSIPGRASGWRPGSPGTCRGSPWSAGPTSPASRSTPQTSWRRTARPRPAAPYGTRQAVCLETQVPADSPNHPEWGDVILRPGQVYERTTEYRFL